MDLMYKCIQKHYYFTSEFHLKKKLPVTQSQIASTFCFTSKYKPESCILKPHLYQGHHTFDQIIINQSDLILQFGQPQLPFQVKIVQLLPFYQSRAPLGSSVFMDQEEFRTIDRDRNMKEQCYHRHVEKLKKKKAEWYDIKTPIPANPNRCFVCEDQIIGDYKEHLKSEQHLTSVRTQPLYDEIDELIAQMNEDLQNEEKNKKKKGRKKGGKNNQQDGISVDQFEISHSTTENIALNNTQEMTNINFLSTEITIAKEAHKRKQRFPISHCKEILQFDKNLFEQKRLQQLRHIQQQNTFLQPNLIQKRKRVQIIEEEKEEIKSISNNNNNLESLALKNDKECLNMPLLPQDRVFYQAQRKVQTKTRKQLKDQQLLQQNEQQKNSKPTTPEKFQIKT